MDGSLNFDGQKYISAKVAAENFGYTSDYVGQLCRGKKVTARQIGRIWYVLESDLVEHKKNTHPGSALSESDPKKTKSSNKIKKNNSATLEKSISKNTEKATSKIFLPGLPNNDSNDIEDKSPVLDNTKKNIAKKEGLSRSSEILDKSPKYEYEETELFPNLVKKIDIPALKYTALESLENSINKPKIKSKFEKLTVSLTLGALFLTLLGVATFGGVGMPTLAKLPFGGAKAELAILYGPYFHNLKNDYANSKKYLSNPEWQFDRLVAASFFSVDPLNSALSWVKDTAYKIAKPWLEENAPVFVVEEKGKDGNLFAPTVPDIFDQPPQTIVQSKTVYVPASDRDYLDLRIEEKFAELKNYFLVNPLAPNVNRYYVTRQNDVITSSLQSSNSSSSSSSGGASALSDLSDLTLSSPAYGEVLMYNGTAWVNTATSSLGIVSGSGASTTLLADFNTFSNTNNFSGKLAVGTSTPYYTFTISSSTGPQLALSNGAGIAQWVQRNAGGNLYFATTTIAGTATTSGAAALSIIGSNGYVGIGTSSPEAPFELVIDNSGFGHLWVTSYGNAGAANFKASRANGTMAAPSALVSGDVFAAYGGSGYGATGWAGGSTRGNRSSIQMVASENWTDTAQGAFIRFFTTPTGGTSVTEMMRISDAGLLGVGTSTPQYRLTVASSTAPQLSLSAGAGLAQWVQRNAGGNLYFATTTVAGTATTSISALEIAGDGFGTTTVRGLNVSAQATSTSNVGINLSGGCFAIGGTCLSNSSASSTLLADSNTWSGSNNFTQKLALSTTTPFAKLSVESQAGEAAFVIGSSTATSFIVDSQGRVGIGTSAPAYSLDVSSTLRVSGTSAASVVFGNGTSGGITIGDGTITKSSGNGFNFGNSTLINGATGAFYGSNLTIGNGASTANIGVDSAKSIAFFTGASMTNERMRIDTNGQVGISTTTPYYNLTVASTTGAQLSLSAGAGIAQWVQRNAGGNLYFATTTVAGTSTSTLSAFTISGSNGNVGVGINNPIAKMHLSYEGEIPVSALYNSSDLLVASRSGGGGVFRMLAAEDAVGNGGAFVSVKSRGTLSSPTIVQSGDSTGLFTGMGYDGANRQTAAQIRLAVDGTPGIGDMPGRIVFETTPDNSATAIENMRLTSSGSLGIGSTTPFARLSVDTTSLGAGVPSFVVGSSTRTDLIVTQAGNVGIGTASPSAKLDVEGNITLGETGQNSSLTLASTQGGTSPTLETSYSSNYAQFTYGSNVYLRLTSGSPGTIFKWNNTTHELAQGYQSFAVHDGGLGMRLTTAGLGISTTTPYYNLTVASTTGAQLSLSAGAGIAQWVQRNAGGNLYFATTTVAGTATTTTTALSIIGSSGSVGVGVAEPFSKLEVQTGDALSGTANMLRVRNQTTTNGQGAGIAFAVENNGSSNGSVTAKIVGIRTGASGIGDLAFYTNSWGAVGLDASSERMRILSTGQTGVGTSTPFALLQLSSTTASATFKPQLALSDYSAGTNQKHWTLSSQGGNFYLASSTDLYATTSISALEISGSGFGTTTVRGLNISGQATSTSNVGINLSGGCFSINNTCISGGGGSGASSTLLADSNTFSGTNNFTQKLGLATTTPFARLSVESQAGEAAFVVGSSTATSFIVNRLGNVGIKTANPSFPLDVSGAIRAYDSSASPVKGALMWGDSAGTAFFQNSGSGLTSSAGMQVAASGQTTVQSYLGTSLNFGQVDNIYMTLDSGRVGISTTTPYYNLTVASTTGAQLSLSAGAGIAQWVQRNAGGNLYFATTTVAGTATSTLSAFSIDLNGNVMVGTTTPRAKLTVDGSAYFDYFLASSTSATSTIAGGLDVGNGSIKYDWYTGETSINNLALGSLNFDSDAGSVSWVDMPVTSSAAAGTVMSYSAMLDGLPMLSIYGESDGGGTTRANRVAIGTSTPYSTLSVWASSTDSSIFSVVNSASSTLFNVLGTGKVGLATTSPFARLSVESQAGEAAFVVGSSTATSLIVNSQGRVGIGTTSPASILSVVGTTTSMGLDIQSSAGISKLSIDSNGFITLKTSGNGSGIRNQSGSNYASFDSDGSYGFIFNDNNSNANVRVFSAGGTKKLSLPSTGILGFTTDLTGATLDTGLARNAAGIVEVNTGVAGTLAKLNASDIRVGTSTSFYNLTIASTTGAQLALSAGTGIAQWVQRNAGGNLYFATTTVAGTATTSTSALTILGSSGFIGIGTTSPFARLSVESQAGEAAFVIGSSTATSFIVDSQGNVGIGTTAPGGPLQIGTVAKISSAGTLFFSDLSGNNILNSTTLSFSSNATIGSGGNTHIRLGTNGNVGISTSTTVYYNLTVASTTGAQLSLSAGAGVAQWVQRNAGGNLYFATTTVAGTATTSTSVFSINGTSGDINLGLVGGGASALSIVNDGTAGVGDRAAFLSRNSGVRGLFLGSSLCAGCNTIAYTTDGGALLGPTGLGLRSDTGQIMWSATTDPNGTKDLGLDRYAAGVLAVTNGTYGNISGTLIASSTGLGTTTPYYNLTVASTTGAQLSLSAGAGLSQWTMRNAGGNLYFATTTVAGTATTSTSAFTILGSSGFVGIGTSTPSATLALQGAAGSNIFSIATSTSGINVITISEWGGITQRVSSSTALSIQMASGTPVFEVDTTNSNTNAGIDITAATSQTANLLNMYSSGGTFLSGFTAAGGLFMNIASTTAINLYDGSSNAAFVVNSTGKSVGIGTSTLSYALTVQDSQASTYVARINNAATDTTADGLLISLGVANANRTTGNYFIGFADGSQTVAGKIQGGASAVAYTTTAADLAEYFRASDLNDIPGQGEVVTLDKSKEKSVMRADGTKGVQDEPLGIVSTNPGFIGNGPICLVNDPDCDQNYARYNTLVAIAGQVPVRISLENGPIKVGDYLTLSSTTPGAAAKLVGSGFIIGQAVEEATTTKFKVAAPQGSASTTPESQELAQTVMVFIKSGWRDIEVAQASTTDFSVPSRFASLFNFFKTIGLEVGQNFIKITNLITEKVTANKVETKELCLEDVCVTKDQLSALLLGAGQATSTQEVIPPPPPTATSTDPVATSTDPVATSTPEIIEEPVATSTTDSVIDSVVSTPEITPPNPLNLSGEPEVSEVVPESAPENPLTP